MTTSTSSQLTTIPFRPPALLLMSPRTKSRLLFQASYHQCRHFHCQQRKAALRRSIVTSSHTPSPQAFIERPETIVLAESSLYKNNKSWKHAGSSFFPMCGLQFATIDLFHSSESSILDDNGGGGESWKGNTEKQDSAVRRRNNQKQQQQQQQQHSSWESLEATLKKDLSHIASHSTPFANEEVEFLHQHLLPTPTSSSNSSSSAHIVLIARGPIQCLVAQYYLESNPLAGLILVDPLLFPENGRGEAATTTEKMNKKGGGDSIVDRRWNASFSKLMSVLLVNNEKEMVAAGTADKMTMTTKTTTTTADYNIEPPLLLPFPSNADYTSSSSATTSTTTKELEIKFLNNLLQLASSSTIDSSSSTITSTSITSSSSSSSHAHPRPPPTALPRLLKLEPNSVPILVLYSGDHRFEEYYQECAERTTNFHAGTTTGATTTATIGALPYHRGRGGGGGGEVDVTIWKIPKTMDHHLDNGDSNNNNNNINIINNNNSSSNNNNNINYINDDEINSSTMMRIYEWYDEMVA